MPHPTYSYRCICGLEKSEATVKARTECPCCGLGGERLPFVTIKTQEEFIDQWIAEGAPWRSATVPEPEGRDRKAQVKIARPPKLLKVTLEYEDRITVAEGELAQEWQKQLSGAVMMSAIHGGSGISVDWTVFNKEGQ